MSPAIIFLFLYAITKPSTSRAGRTTFQQGRVSNWRCSYKFVQTFSVAVHAHVFFTAYLLRNKGIIFPFHIWGWVPSLSQRWLRYLILLAFCFRATARELERMMAPE